jgi:hypothetical protein
VLSPEWVVFVHDYNDETDARIYDANPTYFDEVLAEQVSLETEGEEPNWVRFKARRAAWARGYATFSDQHLRLAEPAFFSITSPDDPAYAVERRPAQATAWVQPLGDRSYAPDAPLRGCRTHQVGHYAYVKFPTPMREGATYQLQQKDGRTATLHFSDRTTRVAGFKLNQVGYHPDAAEKYACLGGWIPTVGGVPFLSARPGFGPVGFLPHFTQRDGGALLRANAGLLSAALRHRTGGALYRVDEGGLSHQSRIRVPLDRQWRGSLAGRLRDAGDRYQGHRLRDSSRNRAHQRTGP